MYSIRVRPGNQVVEASLSDAVPTSEALRAVSQTLALAEAGQIHRILADISEMQDTADWPVVAAALRERLTPPLRLAIVCTATQLLTVRRFATRTSARSNLGVFTRATDAEAWLASNAGQRLPQTTALHLQAPASASEPPAPSRQTGAA